MSKAESEKKSRHKISEIRERTKDNEKDVFQRVEKEYETVLSEKERRIKELKARNEDLEGRIDAEIAVARAKALEEKRQFEMNKIV